MAKGSEERVLIHKLPLKPGGVEERIVPCFGPYYRGVSDRYRENVKIEKERAWLQILTKTDPKNHAETEQKYREAIRNVEIEARAAYAESMNRFSSEEFVYMMIRDGCYMLQLALFFLGSNNLDYPDEDPLFGKNSDMPRIKSAIEAMFKVGNQVPLRVLKELLKQSYFQTILATTKWRKPSELQRLAFFEFLVAPFTGRNQTLEPTDILHGLYLLLLGFSKSTSKNEDHKRKEAEEAEEDDDDLYITRYSASDLRDSGVQFLGNCVGIADIKFTKNRLNGFLSLPSIVIDETSAGLFSNLVKYEERQGFSVNQCHISGYLEFMQGLLRKDDDFKLLHRSGILQCKFSDEGQLRQLFPSSILGETQKTTGNLRIVKHQIRDFCFIKRLQPSEYQQNKKNLLVLRWMIFVLTLMQTVYAILHYHQNTQHDFLVVPVPRI